MPAIREQLKKITPKPVTIKQAMAAAVEQVWQREFNPDYDQVVLRISSAPLQSLRNGQPPPPAK